ncbi:hypothetical protein HPTD01_2504 [Halomonas sp. TD01]|nr:hypothetical protein GME_02915 [Halomonas sp. TD01]CAH1044026.1 hypothetical protein HPTD01_2504 [Halomonas sp. TD01]
MTTAGAGFGAGKPLVDFYQMFALLLRLVRQFFAQATNWHQQVEDPQGGLQLRKQWLLGINIKTRAF